MNHSKAGQKLTPELKAIVEPIYRRNPKRYARLILFVWHYQKAGYSDEAIIQTFKLASRIHDVFNWWEYCASLLKTGHASAFKVESEGHKRARANFQKLADIFDDLRNAKLTEISVKRREVQKQLSLYARDKVDQG